MKCGEVGTVEQGALVVKIRARLEGVTVSMFILGLTLKRRAPDYVLGRCQESQPLLAYCLL